MATVAGGRVRCSLLALVFVGLASCTGQGSVESAPRPSSAPGEKGSLSLELYNSFTGQDDPRWSELPSDLKLVEIPPASTIRVEVPSGTRSVRFRWRDEVVVDDAAPFRLDEDVEGHALARDWVPGEHQFLVEAFDGLNAQGELLAEQSRTLRVSRAGLPPAGAQGQHRAHLFWKTDSGIYVTRNDQGHFVDRDGHVVLRAEQVELEVMPEDQGHLMTRAEGAPRLEFAFQLLVPEHYSPEVKYPLLVFLHHGWEVYRGTDNDGRPLETPLFAGPRSITQSEQRIDFPALILVPQHTETTEKDGIHEEWAAFTDINEDTGSFTAAPRESRSARFTFGILEDVLNGGIPIDGRGASVDTQRIYVAGHSMGGLGVWDWIARRPDYFAAAVPMAGYADHSTASKLAQHPIWAFHHELDCYNPIRGTETMVGLLKKESKGEGSVRFSRLTLDTEGKCDQAHFRTPEAAWNSETELLLWMFSQTR